MVPIKFVRSKGKGVLTGEKRNEDWIFDSLNQVFPIVRIRPYGS